MIICAYVLVTTQNPHRWTSMCTTWLLGVFFLKNVWFVWFTCTLVSLHYLRPCWYKTNKLWHDITNNTILLIQYPGCLRKFCHLTTLIISHIHDCLRSFVCYVVLLLIGITIILLCIYGFLLFMYSCLRRLATVNIYDAENRRTTGLFWKYSITYWHSIAIKTKQKCVWIHVFLSLQHLSPC